MPPPKTVKSSFSFRMAVVRLPPTASANLSGITPRTMNEAEIEECIDAFAQAAQRSKEASFDGVQLHSAHGFLISEFNSPYTNRRTDK